MHLVFRLSPDKNLIESEDTAQIESDTLNVSTDASDKTASGAGDSSKLG